MGTKLLYVWILGILLIAAALYIWAHPSYDNFQVSNCNIDSTDVPAAAERFWKIVADKDTAALSEKLLRVSSPDPLDPNDRLPVKFSNYISMYALARRQTPNDLSGARASLFSCYDTLQREMETNLYEQAKRDAWKNAPLLETCKQLDVLRAKYMIQYASMNKEVQDLSGTELAAERMRDENLLFQKGVLEKCKGSMSAACIKLASQETPVYELLSKYESVNMNVFGNSLDISDNLLTINQVYRAMGCATPNQFFSTGKNAPVFWVDKNKMYAVSAGACSTCPADIPTKCSSPNIVTQGFLDSLQKSSMGFSCLIALSPSRLEIKDTELPFIDTETLRMKLQEMSPYYLSPDIVDAITGTLQSDTAAKVQTTPEILANLRTVVSNIKRYTRTP